MGFEIPIDVDWFDHPKALKMIAILGKNADVYPLRLWAWAAKFAKRGRLPEDISQIENAARWKGPRGKLHSALVAVGVIDPDGVTIHDWAQHTGRKIAAYEQKKAKQRAAYKEESGEDSAGILPEEFQHSSTMQGGILPPCKPTICDHAFINETKRNETTPNETKENETAGGGEFSPEWLARIWVDQLRAIKNRVKRDKPEDVSPQFAEWIENGIPPEEIHAEINNGRDRTEHLWEFKKRLFARLKPEQKPGAETREQRVARQQKELREGLERDRKERGEP